MSGAEVAAFVGEQRVLICATVGPRGWPHLMPLWFLVRGDDIWAWTYAKSQKVRNLERDSRATLQLETGERYEELRGVMIEADTVIHRELDLVSTFGAELFARYGSGHTGPEFLDAVRAQAAKRVALQFVARRTASWDHRKLGGAY
ncbi:MAG: pyridoxamine 5'-phosphate oxidase family protein [Solirubrobacterales bacterium]|nr:pyridoxamine 5'-phosphate oxidase family protein [Solirubrobacterales bacterium]